MVQQMVQQNNTQEKLLLILKKKTSCRLQFYVLTLSLDIVHKTVIVLLYLLSPRLLSGGSVLTTAEAAEDVQVVGFLWCTCTAKL